ncbi:mucin-2-like [Latimeria chalumnae]|uniref:mucin-2-like n=1 Tax=Latimeria chalumnae TaxID=7897 RepID=UPI00313F2789
MSIKRQSSWTCDELGVFTKLSSYVDWIKETASAAAKPLFPDGAPLDLYVKSTEESSILSLPSNTGALTPEVGDGKEAAPGTGLRKAPASTGNPPSVLQGAASYDLLFRRIRSVSPAAIPVSKLRLPISNSISNFPSAGVNMQKNLILAKYKLPANDQLQAKARQEAAILRFINLLPRSRPLGSLGEQKSLGNFVENQPTQIFNPVNESAQNSKFSVNMNQQEGEMVSQSDFTATTNITPPGLKPDYEAGHSSAFQRAPVLQADNDKLPQVKPKLLFSLLATPQSVANLLNKATGSISPNFDAMANLRSLASRDNQLKSTANLLTYSPELVNNYTVQPSIKMTGFATNQTTPVKFLADISPPKGGVPTSMPTLKIRVVAVASTAMSAPVSNTLAPTRGPAANSQSTTIALAANMGNVKTRHAPTISALRSKRAVSGLAPMTEHANSLIQTGHYLTPEQSIKVAVTLTDSIGGKEVNLPAVIFQSLTIRVPAYASSFKSGSATKVSVISKRPAGNVLSAKTSAIPNILTANAPSPTAVVNLTYIVKPDANLPAATKRTAVVTPLSTVSATSAPRYRSTASLSAHITRPAARVPDITIRLVGARGFTNGPASGAAALPPRPASGMAALPARPASSTAALPPRPASSTPALPPRPATTVPDVTIRLVGARGFTNGPASGAAALPPRPTSGMAALPPRPASSTPALPPRPATTVPDVTIRLVGARGFTNGPASGAAALPPRPASGMAALPPRPASSTPALPPRPATTVPDVTIRLVGARGFTNGPTCGTAALPARPASSTPALPPRPASSTPALPPRPATTVPDVTIRLVGARGFTNGPASGAAALPPRPTSGMAALPPRPASSTPALPARPASSTPAFPPRPATTVPDVTIRLVGARGFTNGPASGAAALPPRPASGMAALPPRPASSTPALPPRPATTVPDVTIRLVGARGFTNGPTCGTAALPARPASSTAALPPGPTSSMAALPTRPATRLPDVTIRLVGARGFTSGPASGAPVLPPRPASDVPALPPRPASDAPALPPRPASSTAILPPRPTTRLPDVTIRLVGARGFTNGPASGAAAIQPRPTSGMAALPARPASSVAALPARPASSAAALPPRPVSSVAALPPRPATRVPDFIIRLVGARDHINGPASDAAALPPRPASSVADFTIRLVSAGDIQIRLNSRAPALTTEPANRKSAFSNRPSVSAPTLLTRHIPNAPAVAAGPTAAVSAFSTGPTASAPDFTTSYAGDIAIYMRMTMTAPSNGLPKKSTAPTRLAKKQAVLKSLRGHQQLSSHTTSVGKVRVSGAGYKTRKALSDRLLIQYDLPFADCEALQHDNDWVTGGSMSAESSFPWLVSIAGPSRACKGSILSPFWILTTAQCLHGLADKNTHIFVSNLGGRVAFEALPVVKLFCHGYCGTAGGWKAQHGLALVLLQQPIQVDRRVFPACLSLSTSLELVATGKCWVAGQKFSGSGSKRSLRWTPKVLRVLSFHSNCPWSQSDLNQTQWCMSADSRDSGLCSDDEGAPVVCQEPQTGIWLQVGIVSQVDPSCGPLAVALQLARYLWWLKDTVRKARRYLRKHAGRRNRQVKGSVVEASVFCVLVFLMLAVCIVLISRFYKTKNKKKT